MLNPIEAARERAEKRQNTGHSVPLVEILIRFISYLKENAERSITTAELSKELARHFRGVDVFGNVNLMQSIREHERVKVLPGGMWRYQPKYSNVRNYDDILALVETNVEGVIGAELKEAYHEAADDVARLVQEGKILKFHDRTLRTDIYFPTFSQYLAEVPQSLKESWHQVQIADVGKLPDELQKMGEKAAILVAPPKLNKRSSKKEQAVKKGRKARDPYNGHVDPALVNDDWKNTVSDKAQIYGKN